MPVSLYNNKVTLNVDICVYKRVTAVFMSLHDVILSVDGAAPIYLNSIQKTSILKFVCSLSCGQIRQSMNSDFLTYTISVRSCQVSLLQGEKENGE